MNKKLFLTLILVFALLGSINYTSAQLAVGVKAGDWIQYNVSFTGTPDPTHAISSANMTVLSVSGTSINVNIISTYTNGTEVSSKSTLNLQTGQLIDNFIIAANLAKGGQFYDSNVGNITITGMEQKTYAGATRTVINATSDNNTYVWDQTTGVSVEGISTQPTYTMHSIVNETNMWQAQVPEFGRTVAPLLIAGVLVVVSAAVIIIRKRK